MGADLALDVRTEKVPEAMQKLGMKEGFGGSLAPESFSAPTRPSCRCARLCRRWTPSKPGLARHRRQLSEQELPQATGRTRPWPLQRPSSIFAQWEVRPNHKNRKSLLQSAGNPLSATRLRPDSLRPCSVGTYCSHGAVSPCGYGTQRQLKPRHSEAATTMSVSQMKFEQFHLRRHARDPRSVSFPGPKKSNFFCLTPHLHFWQKRFRAGFCQGRANQKLR
jgi:hypothetical protein